MLLAVLSRSNPFYAGTGTVFKGRPGLSFLNHGPQANDEDDHSQERFQLDGEFMRRKPEITNIPRYRIRTITNVTYRNLPSLGLSPNNKIQPRDEPLYSHDSVTIITPFSTHQADI